MPLSHSLAQRNPSLLPPEIQRPSEERHDGPRLHACVASRQRPVGFVSDYFNSIVNVYSFGGSGLLVGRLAGFSGPQGLTTDRAGNLYVADTLNNRVQVYAPPYNGSPTTLNDPGQYPGDVAVDGSGNIAVTNIYGTGGQQGSVSLYAAGATSPTNTLSSTDFGLIYFAAFDSAGNLYLDGLAPAGATRVGEVAGGISGTAITTLTPANTITYPGGVAMTAQGLIAIDDQKAAAIYSYNPPDPTGSLGSPVSTTPLNNATDPVTFALTAANTFAITVDASQDVVSAYPFPAGGPPTKTAPRARPGQPVGVAIIP